LPDIPVATHHNQFFSEPSMPTQEPPTVEGMQQAFSQMKTFCISQVSMVTFSGGMGKWVTVSFV